MEVSSRRGRSGRRARGDEREGEGRERKVNQELHLFPFFFVESVDVEGKTHSGVKA